MEPIERYVKDLDEIDGAFDRERKAPVNLRKVRVIDLTKAREGTALRLIPVESEKQNLEYSYKLEYVKDVPLYKAPFEFIKNMFTGPKTEITEDKYPESGIFIERIEWSEGPEEVVILRETEDGEAPLENAIDDLESKRLSKMEQEKGQAESEKRMERAKNFGMEGAKRSASENETPKKTSRNRRNRDRKSRSKRNRKRRR